MLDWVTPSLAMRWRTNITINYSKVTICWISKQLLDTLEKQFPPIKIKSHEWWSRTRKISSHLKLRLLDNNMTTRNLCCYYYRLLINWTAVSLEPRPSLIKVEQNKGFFVYFSLRANETVILEKDRPVSSLLLQCIVNCLDLFLLTTSFTVLGINVS